jgi:hypothetical protein
LEQFPFVRPWPGQQLRSGKVEFPLPSDGHARVTLVEISGLVLKEKWGKFEKKEPSFI